jgi:hypothetical protein
MAGGRPVVGEAEVSLGGAVRVAVWCGGLLRAPSVCVLGLQIWTVRVLRLLRHAAALLVFLFY